MKKRERRSMDRFRAFRYGNWLMVGGLLVVFLGLFLVEQLGTWVWLLVSLPGVLLLVAGWRLHDRYVRCPRCYRVLSPPDRWSADLPDFCPYCGTDIRFL